MYLLLYFQRNTAVIIKLMNSAAGHALHRPCPENRAVSRNRQMISTINVRTRDRKPEMIPFENAVKSPEPN